jgi:hypothetical protein
VRDGDKVDLSVADKRRPRVQVEGLQDLGLGYWIIETLKQIGGGRRSLSRSVTATFGRLVAGTKKCSSPTLKTMAIRSSVGKVGNNSPRSISIASPLTARYADRVLRGPASSSAEGRAAWA